MLNNIEIEKRLILIRLYLNSQSVFLWIHFVTKLASQPGELQSQHVIGVELKCKLRQSLTMGVNLSKDSGSRGGGSGGGAIGLLYAPGQV